MDDDAGDDALELTSLAVCADTSLVAVIVVVGVTDKPEVDARSKAYMYK